MAKSKPETISISALQTAVERATKLAAKSGIRMEGPFTTFPGFILGRVLQDSVGLDQAELVAKTITENVSVAAKKAGLSALAPAVLKLPGHIIVGFVEQRSSQLFGE